MLQDDKRNMRIVFTWFYLFFFLSVHTLAMCNTGISTYFVLCDVTSDEVLTSARESVDVNEVSGVVWCSAVRCGVARWGAVRCGVVWCGVVWCGVVLCGVVVYHHL